MKNPAYYVAMFGKPEPPDKDSADSGRFFLGKRGADTPGERGDVLLLYAQAGPAGTVMSAPGIGIVLTKTKEYIFYRYLPFPSPLTKERIEEGFTEEDGIKWSGIGSNTYWLLEISAESFRNAVRGAGIAWP